MARLRDSNPRHSDLTGKLMLGSFLRAFITHVLVRNSREAEETLLSATVPSKVVA